MKKTSAIISGTVLALGATGVVANAQADEVTLYTGNREFIIT